MRKLKTKDIFSACRVLKIINKDNVRGVATNIGNTVDKDKATEADIWDVGFEAVWALVQAASETNADQALYNFLSGPFEVTAADVAEMDIKDLMANIKQMAAENDLGSFFGSAAEILTQ